MGNEISVLGPHPDTRHHSHWLHRSRRLAQLRENFRLLAESYEEG